jgi:23S rRNA pseudouridine1911/1915/1917 synthase
VQSLTGLSRAGVRGLLDHECVRVNDAVQAQGQIMLHPGDHVSVRHDPHTRLRARPRVKDDPAFRILFEDEHLLVVNKAAHVLTVPTESGKGNTLIEALERHINHDRPPRARRHLHVVHRLDRGVSGVLVIARRADVATALKNQFAAHKPQRLYIAIVNGLLESKSGTFRSHLATDASLNRYSTKKPGGGELAVTHYEVMGHARGATVVRVRLETGRRNQIRVHFAEAGHPVLGDPRYPREGAALTPPRQPGRRKGSTMRPAQNAALTSSHPKWKARRLALHARSLAFEHPITREPMRFEAELPQEFEPFMRRRSAGD